MGLHLEFDPQGMVEQFNFILLHKNGKKIGLLENISNVRYMDSIAQSPEISFVIDKYSPQGVLPFWDEIKTFKLLLCKETNTVYEMTVSTDEDVGVRKTITCVRLGDSETRNVNVYGLQINTEESITWDDYDTNFPVVLYRDSSNLSQYNTIWNSDAKYTIAGDAEATNALRKNIVEHASLLHRLMTFIPHYHIGYVDETISNIQRIYTFNDKSVYDCFAEIADAINILFDFPSLMNADGTIDRVIDVYDMLNYCTDCGTRGKSLTQCPNCGGSNITHGYGVDTTICATSEELASKLVVSNNVDEIHNCYHLEAGDDLMTATVRNCNPNGTGYIWSFTQEMMDDMSESLRTALESYQSDYSEYLKNKQYNLSTYEYIDGEVIDMSSFVTNYNNLITTYHNLYGLNTPLLTTSVGYAELIEAYYNSMDLEDYFKNTLIPTPTSSGITAQDVVNSLTSSLIFPVSLGNVKNLSLEAANTAVLNVARLNSSVLYEIKIETSALNNTTWSGVLSATNFYDQNDTAKGNTISGTINSDLTGYIQNKVKKSLYNNTKGDMGMLGVYNAQVSSVANMLRQYSLKELSLMNQAFMAILNLLDEQGVTVDSTGTYHELYESMYVPTSDKLDLIQSAIQQREGQVNLVMKIEGTLHDNTRGLKDIKEDIQSRLNLETYLGSTLWEELNAFRREQSYNDSNYISDFIDETSTKIADNSGKLVKRAYEFIKQAHQDIEESNLHSYTIDTTLRNLLLIDSFKPLTENFACGNWIRVKTEDGRLFRLRLVEYSFEFDNPEDISVTFSDITHLSNIYTVSDLFMQTVNTAKNTISRINAMGNNFVKLTETYSCDYRLANELDYGVYGKASDDYSSQIAYSEQALSISFQQGITNEYNRAVEKEAQIKATADGVYVQINDSANGILHRLDVTDTALSSEITRATGAEGSLSSAISQTASTLRSEISAKTSESDVNALISASVSQSSGAINQALALKTSTSDVESIISQEVSQSDGTIKIALNGKVNGSDYTAAVIAAKINEAGSSININANKIMMAGSVTFGSVVDSNGKIKNEALVTTPIVQSSLNAALANYVTSSSLLSKGYITASDIGTYGTTSIDGGRILTGRIASTSFQISVGATYSTSGMAIDLDLSQLYGQHCSITSDGYLHIKKGIKVDFNGQTAMLVDDSFSDSDGMPAIQHSQHAWKLRSATIPTKDSNNSSDPDAGKRYYTYLTQTKKFVVINEDDTLTTQNVVTSKCTIGTRDYGWGAVYTDAVYGKQYIVEGNTQSGDIDITTKLKDLNDGKYDGGFILTSTNFSEYIQNGNGVSY